MPGTYILTVSSEGFTTATREVVARRENLRIPVTLAPIRPAALIITATDPQGLALPGVVVSLEGPAGTAIEGVTDGAGVYESGPVRPGE